MAECFVGHDRPEVRSTDPDVHDSTDPLPTLAGPAAVADTLGKARHPPEHVLYAGGDVPAIDGVGVAWGGAKRNVEYRPVLGAVDSLAPEHPLDTATEIDLLREIEEEPKRHVVEQLLGIVEVEATGIGHQSLAAAGVSGEKRPQSLRSNEAAATFFKPVPSRQITEHRLRHRVSFLEMEQRDPNRPHISRNGS